MDTFLSPTAAFWRRHIEAHAASGLSAADYCARHDLGLSTFYLWRRKLSAVPAASKATATFAELVVATALAPTGAPAGPSAGIELHHPSGWCISLGENFSRPALERLLDTLDQRRR
jgi:hypothetical protein